MGHREEQLRNDPDQRMLNVVTMAVLDDVSQRIDLSELDREQLPFYIGELKRAETVARQLRRQLEALLSGSDRRCPVCDEVVTGRTDRVHCGATCRQRSVRANEVSTVTSTAPPRH